MEEKQTWVAARGAAKATITKIRAFCDGDLDCQSVDLIQVKLNHLHSIFNEFKSLNIKRAALGDESKPSRRDSMVAFQEYEDKYLEACALLQAALNKKKPSEGASASLPDRTHMSITKLPKIEIKAFTGNDADYYPFINLFSSLIDSDKNLSSLQKLYYLRSYLSGEPHELIKNLPLEAKSYEQAKLLLSDRYDNVNKIISNHVNNLLDIPSITRCTSDALRSFIALVRQSLSALESLDQPVNTWHAILIPILIRKLDQYTVRAYYLEQEDIKGQPYQLDTFITFLEKKAVAMEAAGVMEKKNPAGSSAGSGGNRPRTSLLSIKDACEFCKSSPHNLYKCPKFKTATLNQRIEFLNLSKRCNRCLNKHTNKCKFRFKCVTCNGEHNSLLHMPAIQEKPPEPPVSLFNSNESNANNNKHVLLPTVSVRLCTKDGRELTVRGVLDSGSEVSMITREIAEQLDCSIVNKPHMVVGVCEGSNAMNSIAEFDIHALNTSFTMPVSCSIVERITCTLPHQLIDVSHFNIPSHIQLADPSFHAPNPIHLLLAADIFFQVLLRERIPLALNGPYLVNTKLGYVVGGGVTEAQGQVQSHKYFCNFATSISSSNKDDIIAPCVCKSKIDQQVQRLWENDKINETFPESTSEQIQAEASFVENVQLKNNKFQVCLPLKLPLQELGLGNSLDSALQRFKNLEKRFSKDKTLYNKYKQFIDEYLQLGHAKLVDISQYNLKNDSVYFLPHHPVINENSKTTKLRVVFDGGMLTKNKVSLNDLLLNGGTVQNELFDILILFRLDKHILICDIKQMFRNIDLDPIHRPLQNILWRDSPNVPIQCLQLQTVTYGLKSSSFLATRCLLELVNRFGDQFPKAALAIKYHTYVDDINAGCNTISELNELKNELIQLLSLGGFQLHKWCSNTPEVLKDIPLEKQQFDNIDLSHDTNSFVKTLGLHYKVQSDTINVSCPERSLCDIYTKREVLSFISRYFDPLGMAGPIFLSAKLFLQDLWKSNIGWDVPLPDDLNNKWKNFASSLVNMPTIAIPRHIDVSQFDKIELIGFADASDRAYGCCLYMRVVRSDAPVTVNLLCSKCRLNPLSNKLTTPRCELNSALLLSKLVNKVYNTLSQKINVNNINVHLYLDSQIVLAWLKINPVRLNAYVANRVKMIVQNTDNFHWHYVNTSCNPADCLSRGVDPGSLKQNKLWWKGPQFLLQNDYNHCDTEVGQIDNVTIPEIKKVALFNTNAASDSLFVKFSTLSKTQRVVAYILRFYNNCKLSKEQRNHETQVPCLSVSELNRAMTVIIKHEQNHYYANEIKDIVKNKPIKGNLLPLNPFIDGEGVMRVGGRLQNAQIPYAQKHPVILAQRSYITELIIRETHVKLLHAGPKLMLNYLNQRYWLINGTREIKRVTHKCIICFRLKAQQASQLMGSLPEKRVTAARAFEVVGIDYGGPFHIKQSRARKVLISKGYVLLFICFATKAIHIELASDLTTETFLACLKRFISRRNIPSTIHCDNAATFRGANNLLNKLYELNNSNDHKCKIQNFAASMRINFQFVPSYSPHWAGIWEAGIKSVKYHLKRAIGEKCLTYEELYTVMVQVEGILNSRPLTPKIVVDIDDMSYLTPGHFLTGAPLCSFPEPDVINVPTNRLSFWQQCTQINQSFWRQWHKQYLVNLQSRPKWQSPSPNLQVGTMVIVRDNNASPLCWPIARVVAVHPGADGKVRAIDIKTKNGLLMKTSIAKVCVLPIDK